MQRKNVDEIKFKSLGQKLKPIMIDLVKTIKDMNIEHIVITVSADGDSIIQGSLYQGELDPVIVRSNDGKYVMRKVTEEEIKTNGEELPWN